MTKSQRGGKRAGAGRPRTGQASSIVIRVPAELAPFIYSIKDQYSLDGLIPGSNGDVTRLTDEIKQLKAQLDWVKAPVVDGEYDGNSKEFMEACKKAANIGDKTKLSLIRKEAYAALGLVPTGGGRLKNDSERLAVYQWLKENCNV